MKKTVKFMEKINKNAKSGIFTHHRGLVSYGGYLIATDGKQLAIYDHMGSVQDGYLDNTYTKTADIGSVSAPANDKSIFENIIKIATDEQKYKDYTASIFSFKDNKGDDIFINSVCKLMINSGIAFNFELIKPLAKISDIWGIDYKGPQDNLRFTSGNFIYCIMPEKI